MPNFRVTHRTLGYESELFIAPAVVENAKRGMMSAQLLICQKFRKDVSERWMDQRCTPEPPTFFDWKDITALERIPESLPLAHIAK
jgi:hypothetical protein